MLAAFFDLDDTLVDHSWAERRAAVLFFAGFAERTAYRSAEHFALDWTVVQERHFQRFLAGELTFRGQRRARIREVIRDRISDQEADSIFSIYLRHYEDSWRCFSDVAPCLKAIDEMSTATAVLTNGDPQQQVRKLARTGLTGHFSAVIASGAVGYTKPDPRIFHIACERLGIKPSSAVHIGDSMASDYEGAIGAGLRAILVDRHGSAERDSKTIVVRSLEEVPSIIAAF